MRIDMPNKITEPKDQLRPLIQPLVQGLPHGHRAARSAAQREGLIHLG
jgi:hypothetical protein